MAHTHSRMFIHLLTCDWSACVLADVAVEKVLARQRQLYHSDKLSFLLVKTCSCPLTAPNYPSLLSSVVIEHHHHRKLGKKKKFFFSIVVYSPSLREIRSENWRQKLKSGHGGRILASLFLYLAQFA